MGNQRKRVSCDAWNTSKPQRTCSERMSDCGSCLQRRTAEAKRTTKTFPWKQTRVKRKRKQMTSGNAMMRKHQQNAKKSAKRRSRAVCGTSSFIATIYLKRTFFR